MSRTFAAIAALTFIFASSAASAQMLKTADTPKGKTFVDAKGMTLYTFDKDAGGKSMCNGPCAENWPPLAAADDAKPTADMTIVIRDDGKKMWAYKGKPLYTFKKDTAPGETNGDGFLNGACTWPSRNELKVHDRLRQTRPHGKGGILLPPGHAAGHLFRAFRCGVVPRMPLNLPRSRSDQPRRAPLPGSADARPSFI
jgi:predicted lipoprotein with Yx(FWY)xxD motif